MASITLYYLFLNVFTTQATFCSEEKKWPFVTLCKNGNSSNSLVTSCERRKTGIYGAVHLEAATFVQIHQNQNRKVNFSQNSYSSCRNAPFDQVDLTSRAISLKLRTDEVFSFCRRQIGATGSEFLYKGVVARGLFPV